MSVDPNGVLNVNGPLSGASDGQTAGGGQVIGLGIFNGSTWDRLQGTGGAANVAVPGGVQLVGGTAQIGHVIIDPSSFGEEKISQVDFSSNAGTASCQNESTYPLAPATTSSIQCYIIDSSSGVLLGITWNSLNNATTLTSGVSITCYDSGSNTGRPVWQAQPGAGEYKNWQPYGRPFTELTCASSSPISSGSGQVNVLEVEYK